MKTVSLFLLLLTNLCLAQEIPCIITLASSKDSVLSTEEFTVTYSLSEVEGYIYIGVAPSSFEVIGPDRWEGEIKAGETKTVSFRLKLSKEASESRFISKSNHVEITWGREPFGKYVLRGFVTKSVSIKLKDFAELRRRNTEKAKQSSKKDGNTIQLQILPDIADTIHTRKVYMIGPKTY